MEAKGGKNQVHAPTLRRPNFTTSLGLSAGPTQFGIRERSLSGFLRKNDRMMRDSHNEG